MLEAKTGVHELKNLFFRKSLIYSWDTIDNQYLCKSFENCWYYGKHYFYYTGAVSGPMVETSDGWY